MSLGKFGALIVIAAAIFGVLYLLGSRFLGAGLGDISYEIANGYRYFDAGHYEKSIDYNGSARKSGTVIDARVDDYKMRDNRLFVARRPRGVELGDDGVLRSYLLEHCEYWVVDLKAHNVEQVKRLEGVRCR